ncbi:MAG TPA: pyridoxal-5'-phosphate-dependent protein [Alphaproteobacteria bacterium]|nr:pyridoxal-5'-phosphate-dependent protein [Alphaproteobacteria bacterium]
MTSTASTDLSVRYEDVAQAADRIRDLVVKTPLIEAHALSEAIKGRFFVKCENLQRTGSFKLRGAMNSLASLSDQDRARGVVAYSSGNHAQGVAAAARHFGVAATIIMPEDAPAIKKVNTIALGAKVVTYDRYSESREDLGRQIQAETGAVLVPPYDFAPTIAGQGTSGMEVINQLRAQGLSLDLAIICCGGGGLAAGSALALTTSFPGAQVWAAEPDSHDDTARSLLSGSHVHNDPEVRSICDAIVTPTPGELTLPILQACGVEGRSASDEQALDAVAYAATRLKLIVEPGGAIALAVARKHLDDLQGKTVVAYLSGGNIDPAMLDVAMTRDVDLI